MSKLITTALRCWDCSDASAAPDALLAQLEAGNALFFPELALKLKDAEKALLNPIHADPKRKNISLHPQGGAAIGVVGNESLVQTTTELMVRFAQQANQLIHWLCEPYRRLLVPGAASLRLHSVQSRQLSWRKDDTRLHVDAFPSRPLAGKRILRVFTNINLNNEPRVWRIGEPFESVARRFAPTIKPPLPGSAWCLNLLRLTKGKRQLYDHFMLNLHDAMKADLSYQQACEQETVAFPPGSVWVCFSDQVSHAVMSGQYMMEQTYFVPPRALVHPDHSPLRVLERVVGRAMI